MFRPDLPPLENGEAALCLPLCESGLSKPGDLPLGRYQTRWFFGGYMTVRFETAWFGIEDSTGELKIAPADDHEYGAGFALDLYPVDAGKRVTDVPNTGAGLLDWLRSNPNLVVSEATSATIGTLPATFVDIRLSASAQPEHADCPAPCIDFLGFQQWDHANGILGDDVYGLYVSDVEFGGTAHLLSVTVEGRDALHLSTMIERLVPVLATVVVPASAG